MRFHRVTIAVVLTAILLTVIGPTPIAASASQDVLPPLPEWPVIGPLLQRLGVVEADRSPPPTPDPALPEYRITGFEDFDDLDDIEAGERVRLVVTDNDLNRMVDQILRENVGDDADLRFEFDQSLITMWVRADEKLLEQAGAELPDRLRGDLDMSVTFETLAAGCQPYVEINKLRVNRWSFGLRPVAQRAINTRIPEVWPEQLCIERIILMDDEAAVEGYERP
jgi:hypothetical protein